MLQMQLESVVNFNTSIPAAMNEPLDETKAEIVLYVTHC